MPIASHPWRRVAGFRVNFALQTLGAYAVAGEAPGGGTYTQAAGANQTHETIRLATHTRGNGIQHASDLSQSVWVKFTGVTATANTSDVTDPLGTNTASKVVYDGSGATGGNRFRQAVVLPIGGTVGIWLRTASGTATVRLGTNVEGGTTCNVTTAWTYFTFTLGAACEELYVFGASGSNAAFTIYVWDATGETTTQATPIPKQIHRFAFVANTLRIGKAIRSSDSGDGKTGAVIEGATTNLVPNSDAIDAATWTAGAGVTTTVNAYDSPDGRAAVGDRSNVSAGGNYSRYWAGTPATGFFTFSFWTRAPGISNVTGRWSLAGGVSASVLVGTVGPSWVEGSGTAQDNGTLLEMVPVDGQNGTAYDAVTALHQVEAGKIRHEHVPTTGSTTASRAACILSYPAARFVRAGRLKLRAQFTPKGAADRFGSNYRIFSKSDETTYAEVNATTRVLTIVVGGVSETCAVPVGWDTYDLVELSIEVGGGVATRIRYRLSKDAGTTWTLPFDPKGGAAGTAHANIGAAGNLAILCHHSAPGNVLSSWLHELERIDVTPAWVLQALPTDVASVRAFFRADGGTTLSAGKVTSWGNQTAASLTALAQSTSANQPTLEANGISTGRPSLLFDGSNDYLEGGTLAEWLNLAGNRGTIYVLCNILSATASSASRYTNHVLWASIGAWAGATYATTVLSAYNYDGVYQWADVTATPTGRKIFRWRHNATLVGGRIDTGSEVTATTGATSNAGTNIRVGGEPSSSVNYAHMRLVSLVATTDGDIGSTDDGTIRSFLEAY